MQSLFLAIRSLFRFRLYTLINIIGLALSLACCITLYRYIYSESTVDRCFSDVERMYLTTRMKTDNTGMELFPGQMKFFNFNSKPLEDISVESSTSFVYIPEVTIEVDGKQFNAHGLAVDTCFLQVLDYPLYAVDRNSVISYRHHVVITEDFAQKLFGKEDPMGKNFLYIDDMVTVNGVIKSPSTKTSLQFDILFSQELQWRWPPILNYSIAKIHTGTDIPSLNQRLRDENKEGDITFQYFQFVPFKDFYYNDSLEKDSRFFLRGNKQHIYLLSIISTLILLIGIFNFINIYTAIILKRSKELGMKKMFGAKKKQLFMQLYIENLILISISLFIGWTIVELSKNILSSYLYITIESSFLFNIGVSIVLLFVLPFITTLYPYLKYSYSLPIRSIRPEFHTKKGIRSRNIILCFQYLLTFIILISSIYFIKQLMFMLNMDVGYRTENIIQTQFLRKSTKMTHTQEDVAYEKYLNDEIKRNLQNTPILLNWAPGAFPHERNNKVRLKTEEHPFEEVNLIPSGESYFDIYGFDLIEGRTWDDMTDYPENYLMIINESARKLLEIKDIHDVIIEPFQRLYYGNYETTPNDNPNYRIIGVVKDFHSSHLSQPVTPTAFIYDYEIINEKISFSYLPEMKKEAVNFLKNLHAQLAQGEFEYSFPAEEIRQIYKEDRRLTHIYSLFAFIGIVISLLGLFSISLFDIQNSYKNIAVRKINGANRKHIIKIFLGKYFRVISIAFCLALPFVYYSVSLFMENYTQRTPLSWWIFVIAFLACCGLSLLTLIWQLEKAASIPPVDVIKSE